MANDLITGGFPTIKGAALALPGGRFRMRTAVTRTVLQQEDGVPFYVEFQSPFTPSRMDPENSKYKDKDGVAALPDVADVLNLETGELQVLIGNTVLQSELERGYPDRGYVGRLFACARVKSEVDKRYKVYRIIEMEREIEAGQTVGVNHVSDVSTGDPTDTAPLDNAKAHKVVKK